MRLTDFLCYSARAAQIPSAFGEAWRQPTDTQIPPQRPTIWVSHVLHLQYNSDHHKGLIRTSNGP